jgi:ABC-2 type transport system ATP-binding protein
LWDVVRELGDEGRTVFITTHYMDEAEKLCNRVAVVDHGKIIAMGSPKELIASLGEAHVVEFSVNETPPETDDFLEGAEGVASVRREAGGFVASVREPHIALPAILARLHRHDLTPASLTTRHASLEDVFVSLTGRHLRDGDSK